MKAHGHRVGDETGRKVETFGSATSDNCMSKHLVEMAEKRALSRAVLKLTNLYEHGVFGEDEDVHRDG
jgi:TPR repeat protein